MPIYYDPSDAEASDDYTVDLRRLLASGETPAGATCVPVGASCTVASGPTVSGTLVSTRLAAVSGATAMSARLVVTTSAGRRLPFTLLIPVQAE
jgi:hypothetical protein